MIRKDIEIGTTVFNATFGFGIFKGYETKGIYEGFAIVEFNDFPINTIIHRKRLNEVEHE